MSKSNFEKVYTHILNDEQKQTDLMEMIEMDEKEIDDCLQALGMKKDKWEQMWGKKKP